VGVLPFLAGVISLVFAGLLGRQWIVRRRPAQAAWAVALLLFAAASFALFLGTAGGWSENEFKAYWLLGAVVNVPFLAQGELWLLVRDRRVTSATLLLVIFGTAYAAARIVRAPVNFDALAQDLPLGREVFGGDAEAVVLARVYSYAGYAVLLAGTLWSAWRMRGRTDLRDRFLGTLAIAGGATIVAVGAAFAAAGNLPGFSITLAAGIAVMFWGFLRASRPPRVRRPTPEPAGEGETSH
jgi:hypothetical protein